MSGAADRFAGTLADYPAWLTRERDAAVKQVASELAVQRDAAVKQVSAEVAAQRDAAVKQVSDELTAQRQAVLHDLDEHEGRLHDLLADVRQTLTTGRDMVNDANLSTQRTVTSTGSVTNSVVNRIFVYAIALVVLLLVGIPLSALLHRRAAQRLTHADDPRADRFAKLK
jgi:hypothetical protein